MSRTPLRAALGRLALEGLVDTTRGRTARVSDVSPDGIVELFELRAALEAHAARLAARRRDADVFAGLARDFADAAEHLSGDGVDDYYELIARFDRSVDSAVANPALRSALEGVRTHLVRARRLASDNAARLRRSADEHRIICEAIRDGDENLAVAATVVHLSAAQVTILETLRTPESLAPTESRA